MLNWARVVARLPLLICVCAVPASLSGCSTFALDDGIPNTAPPAVVVGPRPAPKPVALVKQDTGTYPSFGKPITAANTQIGDAEFTSRESQLTALASARSKGAISEAEYQRRVNELRRLGSEHAADAERQIAN